MIFDSKSKKLLSDFCLDIGKAYFIAVFINKDQIANLNYLLIGFTYAILFLYLSRKLID